eukprot:CFRG0269T1
MERFGSSTKDVLRDTFLPAQEQCHNWFALFFFLWTVFLTLDVDSMFSRISACMPIIYGSMLFFCMVYILSLHVCERLVPIYKGLGLFRQRQWDMRSMSTTHALIVSVGGAIAFSSSELRADPVFTTSNTLKLFTSVFHGYAVFDTFLTLKYFDANTPGGTGILVHHALVLFISVVPLNTEKWGMLTAIYLMNEASTIFLNNIHFFKDLNIDKASRMVVVNSITFATVFFVFRIIGNSYVVVKLWLAGLDSFDSTAELVCCWGFAIAILIINLFWFGKIVQGASKAIKGSDNGSAEEAVDDHHQQTGLSDGMDIELGLSDASDENPHEHDGWGDEDDIKELMDVEYRL